MDKAQMIEALRGVLAQGDRLEREWAYADWVVSLPSLQSLRMAQEIVETESDLRARVTKENAEMIQRQIKLWEQLAHKLDLVDVALTSYPHVAKRVTGDGHKIALLYFIDFCECDITVVCAALSQVIVGLESSEAVEIEATSILKIMAYFTQPPCLVLRLLFLPEVEGSGYSSSGGGVVRFRRGNAD